MIEAALADAGMQREQIDWLVMHQVGLSSRNIAAALFGWRLVCNSALLLLHLVG